jgi:stage II sporulation protein D
MRRLLLVLSLAAVSAIPTAAHGASVFVISGKGWGHGVGLSQCGAYGFAEREGWAYDRILGHYYPGTALGPAPVANVRVLLAEGRPSVSIGSDAAFRVESGDGSKLSLAAGSVTLGPDLRVTVAGKVHHLADPVRFVPGASPLRLDRLYRGDIVVHAKSSAVWVVNDVGLEQYLYGVVPGEMPADWAPEALKAQAVAARSYALANRRTGGTFDVYADTRSQVYGGIEFEDERTSAAVDATSGQVLLADGETIANTFFFASSGGRTSSAGDVWGEEIPYLVPVDDPYDAAFCSYNRWGPIRFTGAELGAKLGLKGLRDAVVERDASRRVHTLTLVGTGSSAELPGTTVRRSLALRSTWFSVGVLTLDPVRELLAGDARPVLTGIVRRLKKVVVQRWDGVAWQDVARVRPAADGSFSVRIKRPGATIYRLASGDIAGPRIRLRVGP